MNTTLFSAGAAQIDITPLPGTLINGDFISHYAQHFHDPLYAKALVLQQGSLRIAIILVDICAMQKDFLDQLKQDVYLDTGIRPEHTLIAATHTHAAGSVCSLLLGHADVAYTKWLPGRIVEAVKEAKSRLRPAKIAHGAVDVPEHLRCRRYYMSSEYQALNPITGEKEQIKTNPFGGESSVLAAAAAVDPELCFFGIQGLEGRWISVLANYSLHYVGDWKKGTISADYFGTFSDFLKVRLQAGDDFVGMMSNGTSGDVNIWDFEEADQYPQEDHRKSELIGKELVEKVVAVLSEPQWERNPVLAAQYTEIEVAVRKPSAAELKAARELLRNADYEMIHQINQEDLRQIYAREQLLLSAYPDRVAFPVQGIRIGELLIGGLGGEFFSETGTRLKQQAPLGRYFTITMANDYTGYVPPAHEMEKGGYETWRCRTSYLEKAAEELIRNRLLTLMSQL